MFKTWRAPTDEEAAVLALAEIHGGLTSFSETYTERLKSFKAESIRMIAEWVRTGQLSAAQLADPAVMESFPGRAELQADLEKLLENIAEFGYSQVGDELVRQKAA